MITRQTLEELRAEIALRQIITNDAELLRQIHRSREAASQKINILIQGETGTGKELIAQAIHYFSPERDRPFIFFNCGAGTVELFDSTLFGHVRGAYTGATGTRPGLVEEAHKGILFLDEINSLQLPIQVKLNRFMDSGEFRRLGENKIRKVDVRIIAASNCSLKEEMECGRFREDLFYRIAEFIIEIPPLRQRGDDVRLLMDYFLKKFSTEYGKPGLQFSADAYQKADQYRWPGNVRELENFAKRCVINIDQEIITAQCFQFSDTSQHDLEKNEYLALPLQQARKKMVDEFEVTYLKFQLRKHQGNVEECARCCGKHRSALWLLIRKHGIDVREFRAGNGNW